MTANSNEVATPLPSDNNQIRDRVKLDVYRIYKLENETLETTMAVIQQLYGLNSWYVARFNTQWERLIQDQAQGHGNTSSTNGAIGRTAQNTIRKA